ncbi:FAD-dependent oxidoreductase [Deinococcus sp.]|uniref:FAD-dependent oxidoreductase n=1 Tax=Deinococcus sp. TaxID=47478 RepID=UPI003CC5C794
MPDALNSGADDTRLLPMKRFWRHLPTFLPSAALFLLLSGLALREHLRQPDLLVYGGTPQGVTAAISAARRGLRVVLVEPGPLLGGVLTRGWLATLDDTDDPQGRPIYTGLYASMFRDFGASRSVDVGVVERVLRRRLLEAGVDLRLNTELVSVQSRDGQVEAAAFRHRLGSFRLAARTVIDASDTADLAQRAGATFGVGRQDSGLGRTQMAATLVFRLGGVRWNALEGALADERLRYHSVVGYDERGAYGFGQLSAGYAPSDPARFKLRGLNIARQNDRTLLVNALLVAGVDGTHPAQRRRAYAAATAEAARVAAFLRRASPAAFGDAHLLGVAPDLYIRESRHLIGVSRLHADQVLTGSVPPGSVVTGGYALDGQVYDTREQPYLLGQPLPYGVPYGTLVPQGFSNLLVVSQAASFDSAAAYSARVVPLQMTLGEVAGIAAWWARGSSVALPAYDPAALGELREALRTAGLRVPQPRSSAPEVDRTALLLRRGLFNTPTYSRGALSPDQPILARDFIANLEHWLSAHGKWRARAGAITALRGWTDRRSEAPLTWAGARAIFTWLQEDRWEALNKPGLLTRAEAARLLTDMFPAAERQWPVDDTSVFESAAEPGHDYRVR